ncbi:MAG: PEGA domain-containing protein [Deltaproteobacteria bacterium]|nr:PEGA domain-containing protein [Deltaproteobacteria bacterium]
MMRRAACTLSLALFLGAGSALAQGSSAPAPGARAAFEQGLAALEDDRFAAAAAALEASYRLRAVPVVLFNLGLAYRGLGRNLAAIDAFERYLSAPERSVDPARLAAVRRELDALRAQVVTLNVRVTPSNAVLRVDGRTVNRNATAATVDPGNHMVELEAEGYRSWRREYTLEPGQALPLDVRLEPLPGPNRSPPVRPLEPFPGADEPPPRPRGPQAPGTSARPSRGPSWVFWSGLALTAAAATTSTLLWIDGNATHDAYNSACRPYTTPQDCAARFRGTMDELSDRALMVNIGWAVAGLGALVAALDLLSRPSAESATPRPSRWRAQVSPSQASLAWAW